MIFKRKNKTNNDEIFRGSEFYSAIKPLEKIEFYSDYFKIDGKYASILTIQHTDSAPDGFPAFWKVFLMPTGIPKGVVIHKLETIGSMPQAWVDAHADKAEKALSVSSEEQSLGGTTKSRLTASKKENDLIEIARELLSGDAYLNVHERLFIKAPTLETLDETIMHIERYY